MDLDVSNLVNERNRVFIGLCEVQDENEMCSILFYNLQLNVCWDEGLPITFIFQCLSVVILRSSC